MNFKSIGIFSVLLLSGSIFSGKTEEIDSLVKSFSEKNVFEFSRNNATSEKPFSINTTVECVNVTDIRANGLQRKFQGRVIPFEGSNDKFELIQWGEWERFCDNLKSFNGAKIVIFRECGLIELCDSSLQYLVTSLAEMKNLEQIFILNEEEDFINNKFANLMATQKGMVNFGIGKFVKTKSDK